MLCIFRSTALTRTIVFSSQRRNTMELLNKFLSSLTAFVFLIGDAYTPLIFFKYSLEASSVVVPFEALWADVQVIQCRPSRQPDFFRTFCLVSLMSACVMNVISLRCVKLKKRAEDANMIGFTGFSSTPIIPILTGGWFVSVGPTNLKGLQIHTLG